MKLRSVNVAADLHNGEPWTGTERHTGIDKRAVTHRVRIFDDHVEGDRVIDRKHHGGQYKAVYAYAHEDAQWWAKEIGRSLWDGAFGENLTTEGIAISEALIGEQWRIGTAVLQVTEPRIACRVFAGFWERPNLIKEFSGAGRSGTYLRIVTEGDIGSGDDIDVIHRPQCDLTVGMLNAARLNDAPVSAGWLDCADLSPKWREWIEKKLS